MIGKPLIISSILVLLLVVPFIALSQGGHKRTLIINGKSTQVPVIQINGHSYVGLDALADVLNGSLSSSGDMIALSIPLGPTNSVPSASTPAPPTTEPVHTAPAEPGFSREFLNAGIEQMSTLREWHAALATAIQNGIPLSAGLLAPYRAQATTNLHFASVAAKTPSDHNAYQLLNSEFQNMAKLSDKYIGLRANLTYISPDALRDDDLNRRIIACAHSLGAMAAKGQFADDGSCR